MGTRLLTVVIVLGMGAAIQAQDAAKKSAEAKKDMEALQGVWVAVSGEREGAKAPPDRLKAIKFVFKDDMVTHREASKYDLDPTQNPKTIDVRPEADSTDEKIIKGIYELKGDQLTLCVAPPGGERPTEFATKPGSMTALLVLKKVK